MGECSKTQTFDILDYFFSQGGNFIDTANAYQNGQSETWLGEWVTEKKNRDQIVLATKYGSSILGHAEHRTRFNTGGNGTKSLKLSLESSLERLQTTYIDVLYLQ
jgi:aryl-alcohol dehydrogenase-like predicted oxidoreductase